jgi:3-oxoacyl-[acyl-carrier-protein] synthase III
MVQAIAGRRTNVPAFTVVTGCTGFVYALTIADQFIATGAYKQHPGGGRRTAQPLRGLE